MIISDVSQVPKRNLHLQEGARDPSYKGSEITPFKPYEKPMVVFMGIPLGINPLIVVRGPLLVWDEIHQLSSYMGSIS